MRNLKAPLIGLAFASLAPGAVAQDITINTGGDTGAYHSQFCPVLGKHLEKAGISYECRPSEGTAENMRRIADNPSGIGYAQQDVLALEAKNFGGPGSFTTLRKDDVRECIFAVARAKSLDSYGEVAAQAHRLRIVLPPEQSGSAATFRFLQQIDPYGVGRATDIIHAASTDEAIRIALDSDDAVALFVQFPDPNNPRFKSVTSGGGHIIPVIDRNILTQTVDGDPVYFAQETQVENAGWLASGAKVVTACTPLVVFTGKTSAITDDAARSRHDKIISIVTALRGDDLLPQQGLIARVLKRTRELTATGASKFVDISEQARERAAPLFEKAREAARQAVQGGHGSGGDHGTQPQPAEK